MNQDQGQCENKKTPAQMTPKDLLPAVLPSEVADANLTTRAVHDFTGKMAAKMAQYQGRFDVAWFNKTWGRNELNLEIARCILDRDYVSAANYAMMADHIQSQSPAGSLGGRKESILKTLWLDTETTGVDEKIHDVIQVGYIMLVDGVTKFEGELLMAPQSPIANVSQGALDTNKRTLIEIQGFPPAKDQLRELAGLLDQAVNPKDTSDKMVLAGYNARFDYNMLRATWERAGRNWFGSYFLWNVLDVSSVVAELVSLGLIGQLRNYKLLTLCQYFDIPLEGAHDALEDIKATRSLYEKLYALRADHDFRRIATDRGLI